MSGQKGRNPTITPQQTPLTRAPIPYYSANSASVQYKTDDYQPPIQHQQQPRFYFQQIPQFPGTHVPTSNPHHDKTYMSVSLAANSQQTPQVPQAGSPQVPQGVPQGVSGPQIQQGQVGPLVNPTSMYQTTRVQGPGQAQAFYAPRPPQTVATRQQRPTLGMNPQPYAQYPQYQVQVLPQNQQYMQPQIFQIQQSMPTQYGAPRMGSHVIVSPATPSYFVNPVAAYATSPEWNPQMGSYPTYTPPQPQAQTYTIAQPQARPPSGPGTQIFVPSPQQQQMQHTAPYQKREKKPVTIGDPSTGRDVTEEVLGNRNPKSVSPPLSGANAVNNDEIRAQFAQLVKDSINPDHEKTPTQSESEMDASAPKAHDNTQSISLSETPMQSDQMGESLEEDNVENVTPQFAAEVVASLQSEQRKAEPETMPISTGSATSSKPDVVPEVERKEETTSSSISPPEGLSSKEPPHIPEAEIIKPDVTEHAHSEPIRHEEPLPQRDVEGSSVAESSPDTHPSIVDYTDSGPQAPPSASPATTYTPEVPSSSAPSSTYTPEVPSAPSSTTHVVEEASNSSISSNTPVVPMEAAVVLETPPVVVSECPDEVPFVEEVQAPVHVRPVDAPPDDTNEGKKNRKQRIKEINEKGKQKEGTDMDLFRDAELAHTTPEPTQPQLQLPTPTAPITNSVPAVTETPPTPQALTNHVNSTDVTTPTIEPDDEKENEPLTKSVEEQDASVQEKNERNHVDGDAVIDAKKSVPKVELKYNYKEDQWSPLNPEGKKQYDREFLLSLQDQFSSRTKPDNLPDLPDVILDKSRTNDYPKQVHKTPSYDFFTPGYVKSTVGPGGPGSRQGPGSINRRGSQQGRSGKDAKPQRVIEIPIAPPVELHKAETSWVKKMHEVKREASKTVDDETNFARDDLFRKMRGILNKLTPQKFAKLLGQIQELEINTEERLTGVIDLIFEKAIDEPNFSVPYALLCKTLAGISVQAQSGDAGAKPVTFRVKLLARCQAEFEKDKANEIELSKRQEHIEKADGDKKKGLQMELELAQSKSKRRSTGNIRFIGELFKLKMLTEKIMHTCLTKLLQQGDEESLECLCRLFTTIGKGIDTNSKEHKSAMDAYFNRMAGIIQETKVSNRIKFLMRDVIDLRKDNWVNRRGTNDPKTIDQIHKEDAAEKARVAMLDAQDKMNNKPTRGGGQNQQRGGNNMAQRMDDSGWTTVSSKTPIDMSRMKLTKPSMDENLQLGPAGFRPGQSWGRGSTGGSKQPETENKPPMYGNRFSALGSDRNRGPGRGLSTPTRQSDQRDSRDQRDQRSGRPQQPMSKQRPMGSRGSSEQEREAALAAVRSISSGSHQYSRDGPGSRGNSRPNSRDNSRPSSRDNSRSRDNSSSREPSRVLVEPPRDSSLTRSDAVDPSARKDGSGKEVLDAETIETKAKAILEEFLHIDDKKEALHCISELKGQKLMNVFVEFCYNHVLERSESARRHTASLLHDCIKLDYVKHEDYLTGVCNVVELAEDIEIDVPKIWQYLGELIGPMMEDSLLALSCLSGICLPILTHDKRGKLVLSVLNYISHREGHGKTGDLWRQSGLQWSEFVTYQGDRFKEFITDHKLEYTMAKERTKSCSDRELTYEEIEKEIKSLLLRSAPDEEVFDWIEINVGDLRCKDPKFVRVLMTEVCNSAISVTGQAPSLKYEKKPGALEPRAHVLQKYIDHGPELELQALYGLQTLVHKLEHPPGLLNWLFDELYDLDIISEDAFKTWQSGEPRELLGYAVAKQSVKPFLSSLDEPSSPVTGITQS